MRLEKRITIGGREITVRELTTGEIRVWLKETESTRSDADVIGLMLIAGQDLADLVRMTDLDASDLDAFAPSELRQIYDACREVNADFFALRDRLVSLGQVALSAASSAPSAN